MPATPHAPVLQTDRLILDGHRADDLDALAAMWAEPAVYAYIGGMPRSREDVWLRLLRAVGQWTLFGYGSFVVRDRTTRALLGEVGLLDARRAIDPAIDAPEMGWALAPGAHGLGYAREAVTAVLTWADAHSIVRTTCIIAPENTTSIHLAERVGYTVIDERRYFDAPIRILERRAPGIA